MQPARRLLLSFVLLAAPGALSAQTRSDSAPAARQNRPERRSNDILIEEDIVRSEGATAYDVVQRLRPNWLRQRGPTSIRQSSGEVMIYVDGVRYGDVSTLRGIPASTIIGMRYFNAADATFKFSVTNGAGVIEVYTRLE